MSEDDLLGTVSDDDAPGPGHNSGSASVAASQLRSFIERVERLNEDKKAVMEDIKEVFAEAKASGFDSKTMRKIIAERKKPTEEIQEEEALLDLYRSALGMI